MLLTLVAAIHLSRPRLMIPPSTNTHRSFSIVITGRRRRLAITPARPRQNRTRLALASPQTRRHTPLHLNSAQGDLQRLVLVSVHLHRLTDLGFLLVE